MSNQKVLNSEGPILVEDSFVRMYGFLEYATTNDIILYFPQNDEQEIFDNFQYCWLSMLSTSKSDKQIQSVVKIVENIFSRDLFN